MNATCWICLAVVPAALARVEREGNVAHLGCYDRRLRDNVLAALRPHDDDVHDVQRKVNKAFGRS